MSVKLLVFALCCTLAVTTGYRFKELSKIVDLPLEGSTAKLHLSPTKIGWYTINEDFREEVKNYKEYSSNHYFYESRSYIIIEKEGIITIKEIIDGTQGVYKIVNNNLVLMSK